MTFYEWTKRLIGKDSPTGDLATDIANDISARLVENTKSAWKAHLAAHNAGVDVFKALDTAWASYQQYQKAHPLG